jgi:hypothetical protein
VSVKVLALTPKQHSGQAWAAKLTVPLGSKRNTEGSTFGLTRR